MTSNFCPHERGTQELFLNVQTTGVLSGPDDSEGCKHPQLCQTAYTIHVQLCNDKYRRGTRESFLIYALKLDP